MCDEAGTGGNGSVFCQTVASQICHRLCRRTCAHGTLLVEFAIAPKEDPILSSKLVCNDRDRGLLGLTWERERPGHRCDQLAQPGHVYAIPN